MEKVKLNAIKSPWRIIRAQKEEEKKWRAIREQCKAEKIIKMAAFESSGNPDDLPSIPQLFKGKCVMVTGATGFLGMVLVEKLLRSCPELRELFILIRPSEQSSVMKTYQDFINHDIFAGLRRESPGALYKIRKFAGDIKEVKLGLNEQQYSRVIRDVSFVFHCAANDKFDDECRNIMDTNLLGVKNILDICKKCRNLEALVHVSSAYSFCNHSIIDEQLYHERVDPQSIVGNLEWPNESILPDICMRYLQGRPSLNHLSKALAEILIVKTARLPVIIVRPSIVTASTKEPYHGWIDNFSGPTEFIALCGKGIIRTLLVKENVIADFVPVDIVANTLIAAARYMALKRELKNSPLELNTSSEVPIINCTCPVNNMITWRNLIEICLLFLVQYPSMHIYRKPSITIIARPLQYYIRLLISGYIPAVFLDGIGCLMLQKPRFVSIFRRLHRDMRNMEHYTTHPYFFHSPNMKLLIHQMHSEDVELFPMDQSKLNWTLYMENYVLGIRRYFLKESDSTLPAARSKMRRNQNISMVLKLSLYMFGFFLLIHALQIRGYVFSSTLPFFRYLTPAFDFVRLKFGLA